MSVPSKPSFSESQLTSKKEHGVDLQSLSKPELLELLDRQNKLVNSPALSKLSDKGEKVKRLKNQIEVELSIRDKASDLSDVLTKLTIHEKVEVIEWGEKENSDTLSEPTSNGDILEDERNPLVLIASHSGTNKHQRKIKIEKPEEPLITLKDIEEAYAVELSNKIDKTKPTKKFLPHKTLNSSVNGTKQNKVRDITAATPPNPVFGDVKFITLEESVKLQYKQSKHLKEVQLKHATDRLKNSYLKMGNVLPAYNSILNYRDRELEYNEEESEEEKSNDEC